MGLISIQEARTLGLLDEELFPDLFPGAGRFSGRFGSTAPFFRLPALTGLRTPRFGLGPLLLGLGLSPQASAFTGGRGAVPVGRPPARLADLSPAQQVEVIRRRVEEGVLDPRSLPMEVRAALARPLPPSARALARPAAPPGPPGGTQELALARRIISDARLADSLLAPPPSAGFSPEIQAQLQAQRAGEREDLSRFLQRDETGRLLAPPPTTPTPDDVEFLAALADRLTFPTISQNVISGRSGGGLAPPEAAALAPGIAAQFEATGQPVVDPDLLRRAIADAALDSTRFVAPVETGAEAAARLGAQGLGDLGDVAPAASGIGDLTRGVGPALAGLATAGNLAGAGLGFANENPAAGALNLASAAGSLPSLARTFPEAAGAIGLTSPAFQTATPFLQGIGTVGGLANAALGFANRNPAAGALGLIGTAGAFAPPPFDIAIPVVSALASLFLGGKGGGGSIFEARRQNVGPSAQAGERRLTGALTRGVDATPGIQSAEELLAALGVSTPDTFGVARSPVAVSLRLPPESARRVGLPVLGQGTPAAFEFNPARLAPGSPFAITPEKIGPILEEIRRQPDLLEGIGGSGDVTFQNQAASEVLAARIRANAQAAIRSFLGLPSPTAQTSTAELPPPSPSSTPNKLAPAPTPVPILPLNQFAEKQP